MKKRHLNLLESVLGGSDGKESTCKAGDLGSIPRLGRSPRRGYHNPLQYSCPENSHRQRSLAGYSSWGRKESDMTETTENTHCRFYTGHLAVEAPW